MSTNVHQLKIRGPPGRGSYTTAASNWVKAKVKLNLFQYLPPLPHSPKYINTLRLRMGLLKQISKNVILQDVIKGTIPEKKPGEIHWRVLVLDHFSSKVVSSCCNMHDITMEGVTLVEDLLKKREPLHFLEAIYLLKPTDEQSLSKLVDDLEAVHPLYKAFHIFFLELCPKDVFERIAETRNLSKIKTFKEVSLSFLSHDSHVFMVENRPISDRLYFNLSANFDAVIANIDRIAGQIASLCSCLGEMPSIRYRSSFMKNSELALVLDQKLQQYKQADQTLGEGSDKAKSQLIILDRGFDCVSPLLHELTFEAMIHDLLPIDKGAYKFKSADGKEKKMYLDEDDDFWHSLKHMHIGEVSKKVPEDYKKFIDSKNVDVPTSRKDQSGPSIRDLQLMLKKLPQYQKELTLYSNFINIAGDCMKQYQRIGKLCSVEQDLATGIDANGEKIRDFMNQLNPILLDHDAQTGFSDLEKLRIIILYILYKNGIPEDSLAKLLSHANVNPNLRQAIDNLSHLGHKALISNGIRKETHQLERKVRDDDRVVLVQSRWIPVLKDVIEFAIEDRLDKKLFPYQTNRGGESGYKTATSTRYGNWYPKSGNAVRSLPRIIIFIVGGVTYSEIRSVYEINKSQAEWEIVIGSTNILTPDTFVNALQELSESE